MAVARQGGGNRDGPRLVLLQFRAGGIQPHATLSAVYQGLAIRHEAAGKKKDGSVMEWGVGEGPAMQGREQEFKQRCITVEVLRTSMRFERIHFTRQFAKVVCGHAFLFNEN